MDKIGSTNLIQVCIVVRDIEKAVANCVRLFGVEAPQIRVLGPQEATHAQFRGQPCHSNARLCSFKMGNVSLEFVQPDDEPSVWKEFLDKRGEGVCYIGFTVDNSAEALDFLQGEGVEPIHWGDTSTGNWNCVDAVHMLGVMLNIKQ